MFVACILLFCNKVNNERDLASLSNRVLTKVAPKSIKLSILMFLLAR